MSDQFEGTPRDLMLERAALIVALVQGRESPTRTDYAHPRIKDVIAVLKEAAGDSGTKSGAGRSKK